MEFMVPHQLNEAERDSEQTSYHPSFGKRSAVKEYIFCTHINLVSKKKYTDKLQKEKKRRTGKKMELDNPKWVTHTSGFQPPLLVSNRISGS